jgi:hypothetical protein
MWLILERELDLERRSFSIVNLEAKRKADCKTETETGADTRRSRLRMILSEEKQVVE